MEICLFKQTGRGRPSSELSGTKRAAAAFATVAPVFNRMRGHEEPTCAAKESGDGTTESSGDS